MLYVLCACMLVYVYERQTEGKRARANVWGESEREEERLGAREQRRGETKSGSLSVQMKTVFIWWQTLSYHS